MKTIGIIGAMENEISLLKEKITDVEEKTIAGMTFILGKIPLCEDSTQEFISVVLVKSGIGKVNAGICAQILCTVYNVCYIINTGIAGAISDKLKIFDIVVSKKAIYHDVDVTGFGYPLCQMPGLPREFLADKKSIDIIRNNIDKFVVFWDNTNKINIHFGTIASGDQFINKNIVKEAIEKNTDASCVEMEGTAIAHVSSLNNVPFTIIRCISDMADDGGESTYSFNEDKAGEICANFVLNFIGYLGVFNGK